MKHTVWQKLLDRVDTLPHIGRAWHNHSRKVRVVEFHFKGNSLPVSPGGVMREDVQRHRLAVLPFPLPDFVHIVGKVLVIGRVVVEDVKLAIGTRLD